jgi:hypothetical protein
LRSGENYSHGRVWEKKGGRTSGKCFGFDDELSRDHDWGPAFCLWLSDEDHERIGADLQRAYAELPATFMGFGPRRASPGEEWRVGVSRTTTFFRKFTGLDRPPATLPEWLRIPEHALAACTNGKVFCDPLSDFTRWRQALLNYYPEDVRLKKIASLSPREDLRSGAATAPDGHPVNRRVQTRYP